MKNKSRKKKTAERSKNKSSAKHVDDKVHKNPNTQQTNNTSTTTTNRDLKGMKEWLNSLSYESLVNALEFTFQMNEGSSDNRMDAVSNLSTSQQSHDLCEDERSSSGSYEFDLLMKMLSFQSPDIYDDESCHEWRRSARSKLQAPCFFRWDTDSEKNNTDINNNPPTTIEESTPDSSSDPLASLLGETAGLPSELLDVLAQAGVKRSTSALLETFNEVDELDQAFESLDDCQSNMMKNINTVEPSLDHISTNFTVKMDRLNDGTLLGTTTEQQNADRNILLWTALIRDRPLNNNNTKSVLPKCTLIIDQDMTKSNQKQKCKKVLLLNTLHVASRGKFLSSNSGKQRCAFLAPWFDPTHDWFSLAMYLASRFEASLWDAYLNRDKLVQMAELQEESLVHSVKSLEVDAIERILCHAVGLVIRDEIKEGTPPTTSAAIRKSLLWKLLISSEDGTKSLTQLLDGSGTFATTPLLEWGTPTSELKSRVMEYLQEGFAHEAERSLMQSTTQAEDCKKPSTTSKKKKKRSKKKGHNTKKIEDVHTQSIDEQNSDDEEEPHVECILHPTTTSGSTLTDFCEDKSTVLSSQSENNSTKMVVLQVLDDILGTVFDRLGVQSEEDFNDFTDAIPVKSPSPRQSQKQSVHEDIRQSVDDSEVASTAIISNKGPTSVGAAMDFLKRSNHIRNHSQSSVKSHELWASRSRRPSLSTGANKQQQILKRSMSYGDGSMLKKPPNTDQSSEGADWQSSSDSPLLPQASQNETSIFDGAPLCLSGALDGWNSVACKKKEDASIFTDLLQSKKGNTSLDGEDINLVSSTAASIASSSTRDLEDAADLDLENDYLVSSPVLECDDEDTSKTNHFIRVSTVGLPDTPTTKADADIIMPAVQEDTITESPHDIELSPPPSAPPTPPPTLSPILVSLADLGQLREVALSVDLTQERSTNNDLTPPKADDWPKPPLFTGSPPKALTPTATRTLKTSLSRDDLRSIDEGRRPPRSRDDHHTLGHRQVDALLSYRNVVAQSGPRKPPSVKSHDGKHRDDSHPSLTRSSRSIRTSRSSLNWPPGPDFPSLSSRDGNPLTSSVASMPSFKEPILNKVLHLDLVCAQSESGLDGVDDASHINVIPRAHTDDTMTKDGATTISSTPEAVEKVALKEERDSWRDMCLTLGAENAKLRNLLASKMCEPLYHPSGYSQEVVPPYHQNYEQQWPAHSQFPNQFSSHSIVAMSDAGHRADYDSSAMSEDGADTMHPSIVAIGHESQSSIAWQARGDQSYSRRTSAGGTYAESDTSLDHNIGQNSHVFSGLHQVHPQDGPIPLHGIESRLSKDISRYMVALKSQLKKTEGHRLRAVEAMSKTVKALWPRAQIKMYGSHITQLCLPSSDLDFVISLPAVHKNAPATAPGDLEGRNAIIETNQKVLARRLKAESWPDQRTIKVIERTAVPVIKVSTKGSRSRVVQLDLSFDAKEHHGLEALKMIQLILEVSE